METMDVGLKKMTFYKKKERKYGNNGSCTIFHPTTFRSTNIILRPGILRAFGHKMRPPIFTCSTDKNRKKMWLPVR